MEAAAAMSTNRDATQNARTVTKGKSRERKEEVRGREISVLMAVCDIIKGFDRHQGCQFCVTKPAQLVHSRLAQFQEVKTCF